MIRVTFELLPGGNEQAKRTIGLMEIARIGIAPGNFGEYFVGLKKTPPYTGALRLAWRQGRLLLDPEHDNRIVEALLAETDELLITQVAGYHRQKRGIYDLVYMALRACGLENRNPRPSGAGLPMPEDEA